MSAPGDPGPRGALTRFLRAESDRILAACTRCGKCFEACPMTPYGAPGASSGPAVEGILSLLRGGTANPEGLGWASVCIRTGACVPACPENVNPAMMVRIARIAACGGFGDAKQIPVREDRDFFDRVRAFAKLQLTEEEIERWT